METLIKKINNTKEIDLNQKRISNQIFHGDVIQTLSSFSEDVRFDIIIADPPYNIGKDFGEMKGNMSLMEYKEWSKTWIEKCFQFLKDDGLMYIYGFSEILAHLSVLHPLECQRWLIWHYTNKSIPGSKFWQRSHEAILCVWKPTIEKPALYIDQIREPYTETYLKNAVGKVRKGTTSRFNNGNGKNTIYQANQHGALPRDVIKVPALAGGAGAKERWFECDGEVYPPSELKHFRNKEIWKHETQKPMKLTERLFNSCISKNQEGHVLIPFVGSGSECVVAKKMNITYTGIELNSKYVRFAKKWLSHV